MMKGPAFPTAADVKRNAQQTGGDHDDQADRQARDDKLCPREIAFDLVHIDRPSTAVALRDIDAHWVIALRNIGWQLFGYVRFAFARTDHRFLLDTGDQRRPVLKAKPQGVVRIVSSAFRALLHSTASYS